MSRPHFKRYRRRRTEPQWLTVTPAMHEAQVFCGKCEPKRVLAVGEKCLCVPWRVSRHLQGVARFGEQCGHAEQKWEELKAGKSKLAQRPRGAC